MRVVDLNSYEVTLLKLSVYKLHSPLICVLLETSPLLIRIDKAAAALIDFFIR